MTTNLAASPCPDNLRSLAIVQYAARELIDAGFAVCAIDPQTKLPSYPQWQIQSLEPDLFDEGDGVGIVCGPISGPPAHAVVCLDLDDKAAVEMADDYLPRTEMCEGRASKPNSHRWFAVPPVSIPAEHKSYARTAAGWSERMYGHPGPATKSFRGPDRHEIIRLCGTGSQCVVPPSLHSSGERREWAGGRRGEPAVVLFPELLERVENLARACGWVGRREAGRRSGPGVDSRDVPHTTLATYIEFRVDQYLRRLPPSISGHGGHDALFRAANVLCHGFGLDADDALYMLVTYFNPRCRPEWELADLLHKIEDAISADDHEKPRGHLLGSIPAPRTIRTRK